MHTIKYKLQVLRLVNVFKRRFSTHISKKAFLGPNVQILGLNNITIGDYTTIGENTLITVNKRDNIKRLIIGNNVYLGRDNFFTIGNLTEIKDYCIFGNKCSFISSNHIFSNPLVPYALSGETNDKSIIIGVNCWLGHNVSIIGDVIIGHGCIIGANSVVVNSIPPFSIAVGNPARVIKRFNFKSGMWEKSIEIEDSEYLDENKYLNILKKENKNVHISYHSGSSKYGDI